MSFNNSLSVNIAQQDQSTQEYPLVVRDFINTLGVNTVQWMPSFSINIAEILIPNPIPTQPLLLAYVKNVSTSSLIGVAVTPQQAPGNVVTPANVLSVLSPGGVFLFYSPTAGNAQISTGIFNGWTCGFSAFYLGSSDANGLVDLFLGC